MNASITQLGMDSLLDQGHHVLQILDSSGDLTLTWNPEDPEDVARARAEVDRLKAAGYTFFAVVGATGADEIECGNGELIVRHIQSPLELEEDLPPEPGEEAPADPLCGHPGADGKPCSRKVGPEGRCWQHSKKSTRSSSKTKTSTSKKTRGKRSIAMRPMAGG